MALPRRIACDQQHLRRIGEHRLEAHPLGLTEAPARGIARFTQAFRAQYYQFAKRVLRERDQIIPCYAGWASAHVAPNGDLWSCCIRAEQVGNLRKTDYDLMPIWKGQAMAQLRGSIKRKECACPMANATYANMLLHPPTVAKVMTTARPRAMTITWSAKVNASVWSCVT